MSPCADSLRGKGVGMTGASRHSTRGKALKLLPFVFILALAGVLVACGSSGSSSSTSSTQTSWKYSSPITADSATGFVTEDQWAQYYPNEASTFDENSDWSAKTSYIDEYPFLSIIYEGTPFSTDYDTPVDIPTPSTMCRPPHV